MIGRLQRLPLREVWPHEAHHFTVWLEENIDALDAELGLGLEAVQREQAAGAFSVDLIAEREGGGRVVIENQLEKSDHDHLGKLITYLAAFDAEVAVWIVAEARPEHVQAIAWLNESSASFYLVKVEAVRIGDSDPAPVFTLIVGPSDEARQIGERKQELSDQQKRFQRLWPGLMELDSRTPRDAPRTSWISSGAAGPRGATYFYNVLKSRSRVELYMGGPHEVNEALFAYLHAHASEIEKAFGGSLDWDHAEGRKAQRVAAHLDAGWGMDDDWASLHSRLAAEMERLRNALHPYVSRWRPDTALLPALK